MFSSDLWPLNPVTDGELVRRVYARSWPETCRSDFSADEVITRLGERELLWWQRKVASSPIRIGGGPALGGFGFALAAPEGDGWDLGYLFVEPEAFGAGLAGDLHDAAITQLRGVTDLVGGWVLQGNVRSQRFLTTRGWVNCGLQAPPWQTTAAFIRYELTL